MKAVVQVAPGEPTDTLRLAEVEDLSGPAPGEVLINVTLAPVHHGDLHLIRSQATVPEDGSGVPRGSEAVGIVRALGADVEREGKLRVGDRVIGFPAAGSWAESVIVSGAAAIPVPPELGDDVAAQLLVNYVTARVILRSLRKSVPDEALREGAVLVTGASTAVARLLLHLLVEEGLTPVGLTRRTASATRVAAELADGRVTAAEQDDWPAQVASLAAGRKIVGVLDCVSGALVADLVPLLADGAAIVTYGALGGATLGIGAPEIIGHQLVLRGITFTRWFAELSREEQMDDVRSAIALGVNRPSLFKVGAVHDLAEFQAAVSAVEAPNRDGFVFFKP